MVNITQCSMNNIEIRKVFLSDFPTTHHKISLTEENREKIAAQIIGELQRQEIISAAIRRSTQVDPRMV